MTTCRVTFSTIRWTAVSAWGPTCGWGPTVPSKPPSPSVNPSPSVKAVSPSVSSPSATTHSCASVSSSHKSESAKTATYKYKTPHLVTTKMIHNLLHKNKQNQLGNKLFHIMSYTKPIINIACI